MNNAIQREIVHFTYDLDFVLERGVEALTDKIICVPDPILKINGKDYLKLELSSQYCEEMSNGILIKVVKDILEKKYPDGCLITIETLQELSNEYINHLVEDKPEELNYDSYNYGYVVSRSLKKRYWATSLAQHYNITLYLSSLFFGIDDLIKGKYTKEDIINFVEKDIIIDSDRTTVETVIQDMRRHLADVDWWFKRIKDDFY